MRLATEGFAALCMYALPPSLSGALQVFYYALKAVVYPMAPVFDMQVGLQPSHHATHQRDPLHAPVVPTAQTRKL